MPATSTVTVALKRALFAKLTAPGVFDDDVDVHYALKVRHAGRKYIYLGRAVFEQQYVNHRGSSARLPREETVLLNVFVEAWQPGAEQEDMDDVVVELGQVLEHLLASNANLSTNGTPDVPGLVYGGVAGGELDGYDNEAGVGSILSYQLRFLARLN